MAVTFRPRISWTKNDLLLPADLFGVKVPPGVSQMNVRAPNYVDSTQMMQLARDKNLPTGLLSITEGLVTPDLKVNFANFAGQWRRSPMQGAKDTGHGPYQYQFSGGEVYLDLSLGVYILKTGEPDPDDDLQCQIFALLYGHELLHVLDHNDIINNWLVPQLNSEPTVMRYLIQAQPTTYGLARQLAAEVDRDFQQFIGRTIQTAIFNVWATEANRRQKVRDAPGEYKKVQDQVDDLRAAQVNRPHR